MRSTRSSARQLRSTGSGNRKLGSKTGRPPTKKTSLYRKTISKPRLPDLTGKSDDDREELLAAVKAAVNARNVACSGPFWKQMEPYFAFITLDDLDFLKQQVKEVDDIHANTFGSGNDQNRKADLVCIRMPETAIPIISSMQRTSQNGCLDNEDLRPLSSLNDREDIERCSGYFRLLENMLPLSQRLLSALIVEEDVEEAKKAVKFPQEESPCGNCYKIESETLNAKRMHSEIESEVELQNWKNHISDGSLYGSHNAHVTENNFSDDFGLEGNILDSEKVNFRLAFGVLDERRTQSGGKSQDDQQPDYQTMGLNSGIAMYDFEYQEMCLDQRILLELQSIGLFPESVDLSQQEGGEIKAEIYKFKNELQQQRDLSRREDDEIKSEIYKLKNELQQQVARTRVQLQNLYEVVSKGREVEERERGTLAMNKLVEIAYNRYMGCKGNSKRCKGNKVAKHTTLAFVKWTLAKYGKFLECHESCFTELI